MEIKSVKMLDDNGNVIASSNSEDKTEESVKSEEVQEEVPAQVIEEEPVQYEIKEEDVLSYVREKKNIEINSLDDLSEALNRPKSELDEEIETYLKYKNETGRGMNDFLKLNKDYDNEDPNSLIREYYRDQDPSLNDKELDYKMNRFSYDEDFDDENDVIGKKLAQKDELAKAKQYFDSMKDQYKVPLESSRSFVPDEEKEQFESYKEYLKSLPELEQESQKKAMYFSEQTNNLFNDQFEGFNIDVNGKKLVYKPGDAKTLMENQNDVNKFLSQFVDDKGYLKNAEEFHRAIAVASDINKFYNFAYEQAKADVIKELESTSKNIDMGVKGATTVTSTGGIKMRVVDDGNDGRYVIKSNKK